MSTDLSNNAGVVAIRDACVRYGETVAFQAEHLDISRGERVFVLGRSGSGKTTFARLIKGRIRPTSGRVLVLGKNPAARGSAARRSIQRQIAMIDQEFHLVPRLTVIGNVLNGCLGRVKGWKSLIGGYPGEEWEKAESILREVGLDGFGNRRVETLSGGQRQRAAIARALMQDAEVILADEPVSNLDPELAEDALELLVACTARRDVALIVNLHQPRLARQFATRVIGLSNGRTVYDGPPERLSETDEEFIYLNEPPRNPGTPTEREMPHDGSAATMA